MDLDRPVSQEFAIPQVKTCILMGNPVLATQTRQCLIIIIINLSNKTVVFLSPGKMHRRNKHKLLKNSKINAFYKLYPCALEQQLTVTVNPDLKRKLKKKNPLDDEFSLSLRYMEVFLPAEFREENRDAEKSHTHGWSPEFLKQRNPKKSLVGQVCR